MDVYKKGEKSICYPKLMTDPYDAEYYQFKWAFNNTSITNRYFKLPKEATKVLMFCKLHFNDILFSTDDVNYFSLQNDKNIENINTYKGVYTRLKAKNKFSLPNYFKKKDSKDFPSSRYYAYMRRLCNLYFQNELFGEMITIEQSIKHLIEYYQLRQSYLGIDSGTKLTKESLSEFRSRTDSLSTTAADNRSEVNSENSTTTMGTESLSLASS